MAEQRFIVANALIDWLTRATGFRTNCDDCTDIDCLDCIIEEAIKNAPTIEAKPVVHARWENIFCLITPYDDDDYEEARCKCSNCTMITDFEYDYCPYCGAQMDEDVEISVISMEDVPKIMEEMEK